MSSREPVEGSGWSANASIALMKESLRPAGRSVSFDLELSGGAERPETRSETGSYSTTTVATALLPPCPAHSNFSELRANFPRKPL